MQRNEKLAIIISALALSGAFIAGWVTLESRVSRLESSVEEYQREKGRIFELVEENIRQLGHLKGRVNGKDE